MRVQIDVRGLQELVDALGLAPSLIDREAHGTMRKSVDLVEEAVVGHTPVNTGALRGSIGTHIAGSLVGSTLTGRVSTAIPYAEPVEYGRAPGKMPPVEAIQYWVVRKRIATGQDARSVAFVIARAIGRRGTRPGAQMFQKGFDETEGRVLRLWEDLPGKIVGKVAP